MECRICFDEKEPLIRSPCACKGTQERIHVACLKQWIRTQQSLNCSVCHSPFRISVQAVPTPWGWNFLGSQYIFAAVLLSMMISTQWGDHIYQLWCRCVHTGLLTTYLYVYYPVIHPHINREYLRKWLTTLYLKTNWHVFFPWATLSSLLLTTICPRTLCLIFPFQAVWSIHVCILISMGEIIHLDD